MKIAVFNGPQGVTAEAVVLALHDMGLPHSYLQKELRRKWNPKTKKIVSRIIKALRQTTVIAPQGGYPDPMKEKLMKGVARSPSGATKQSASSQIASATVDMLPRNDEIAKAVIGLQYFQIEKCYLRNLAIGKKGNPRILKLLQGFTLNRLPANRELVSPSGAALIAGLCEKEESIPAIRLEKVGFGPDNFMLSIGETVAPYQKNRVLLLETNIDDLAPQAFELLYERLFKAGALDVWVESILMKKMRPAFKLSVLHHHRDQNKIAEVIFKETPSLGVRFLELDRFSLARKSVSLKTRLGRARVKIGFLNSKHTTVSPEYDDVKRLARRHNLPFRTVQREIKKGLPV